MSGLKHEKVAEAFEAKGQLKKAADHYAEAARYHDEPKYLRKAYKLYQEVLSRTNDRFVISDIKKRLKKLDSPEYLMKAVNEAKRRSLEKRVYVIASILALVGALFFISLNLTGNVSGMSERDSSLMGILLFFLGIFFAFLLFKKNKF